MSSNDTPDMEDRAQRELQLLHHAVLDELRAINAFAEFDVSDHSLQILAQAVTDRIDPAFAVTWSPDWVPLGRPHTWADDHGWQALCNDCLKESPASRTEDEVVAWFDDHTEREHS